MAEVSFAANAPSAVPAPAAPVVPTPAPAPAATPVPTQAITAPAPAPAAAVVDVQATVTRTENPPPAQAPTSTAMVPVSSAPIAFSPTNVVTMDRIPGFDEIIWPRINIAQAIGELGKAYPVGSIVHNQQTILYEPTIIDVKAGKTIKEGTKPIRVVCLGFLRTRYVEKVVGGGRGAIVLSEQAVKDAGGTLDYNEWNLKKDAGMKRFEVLEEGLFAIERPEHMADDGSVFVFPVGDKKYALAIYGMKGTAYTAAAKGVLFTQRASGCLREGYPTRVFAMSTRWKDFPNGNGAWVPVLLAQEATGPEFRNWALSITNPQALAAAEQTSDAAQS